MFLFILAQQSNSHILTYFWPYVPCTSVTLESTHLMSNFVTWQDQILFLFCTSSLKAIQTKNEKNKSAKFSDISSYFSHFKLFFTQFNLFVTILQMIYDQSFCYLCVGAGNLCLHGICSSHMVIKFLLDKLWLITHLFSI
jgi:hypothetical protein